MSNKFRSTVKGELSDHGKALLNGGWTPTRWEHQQMGVIEVPLDGDVVYRHTLPNGVTDTVTRDGQLQVSAPRITARGADGNAQLLGLTEQDGVVLGLGQDPQDGV